MSAIQTIRRNSKAYSQALENAYDCRVYTLSNGFCGADCNPLAMVRYMDPDSLMGRCKLYSKAEGRYTLHVHSNCWFEFSA